MPSRAPSHRWADTVRHFSKRRQPDNLPLALTTFTLAFRVFALAFVKHSDCSRNKMPKAIAIKPTIVIPPLKVFKTQQAQPNRVVATKKQLLVLKPFYARVGVEPGNDDLLEASRETGL